MGQVLILCFAAALLLGCNGTERRLERSAASNDPARLVLKPGYDPFIRSTILPDGVQAGLIQLGDGGQAKFWFLSHHLTDDNGMTRFELADGGVHFVHGAFCCEVMLARQPTDAKDLLAMIHDLDGEPF